MWQRFVMVLSAIVLLLLIVPAVSQERAKKSTQSQPARVQTAPVAVAAVEITTVTADNGNRISFLEPEEGVMLIVEEGQYPNESVLQRTELREQQSPVALYRALQPQRAVPARLKQAEQRLVISAKPTDEDPEEPPIAQPGTKLKVAAVAAQPAPAEPVQMQAIPAQPAQPKQGGQVPMEPGKQKKSQQKPPKDTRAEWFQNKFCGGGSGTSFKWCWLDRTGTSNQQRWSLGMGAVVYSCGGKVRLKFQYKRFGKWRDYASRDVLPGYYYSTSRVGIWRTRRATSSSAHPARGRRPTSRRTPKTVRRIGAVTAGGSTRTSGRAPGRG